MTAQTHDADGYDDEDGADGTIYDLEITPTWIRSRLDTLKHLPHPDERFTYDDADLHPRVADSLGSLAEMDVVATDGTDHRGTALRYTEPAVYEFVADAIDERPAHDAPMLPCGDYGFRVEDGCVRCKQDRHLDGPDVRRWDKDAIRTFWDDGTEPTTEDCDHYNHEETHD